MENYAIILLDENDGIRVLTSTRKAFKKDGRGVDHSKFWCTNAKKYPQILRKICVLQARFFIFV